MYWQYWSTDHDSFYHGRVFGEIESHAQMHIDDGIVTGSITISDETFHIEVSIKQDWYIADLWCLVFFASQLYKKLMRNELHVIQLQIVMYNQKVEVNVSFSHRGGIFLM